MKASELKGRAVISLAEAQKVGEVENVVFDLGANQVAGFRVKQGLFGGQWLHAADVQSIGPDAMMIANRELLHDKESVADLSTLPGLDDLTGIKVVTETGTHLGTLGDADVETPGLGITAYYMSESLWEHLTQGSRRFASAPGLRFGGKLLIVPDAVGVALTGAAAAAAPAPAAESSAPPATDATPATEPAAEPALAPPPAVADAAPPPYPATGTPEPVGEGGAAGS